MEYLLNFKVPPHKILINYKGEKSNFTVEKPGRHHTLITSSEWTSSILGFTAIVRGKEKAAAPTL